MKTKQPLKRIPAFASEDAEREFWSKESSTEYVDWSKATPASFPRLKPSLKTISLRLPEGLIDDLKRIANQRDVPYQSLLKIFLAERVAQETRVKADPRTGR